MALSEESKEALAYILIATGAVIAFFAISGVAIFLYEKNLQCPAFARNVERPYRYDWFAGGCFVQTREGQWVAAKNYWNNPVLK